MGRVYFAGKPIPVYVIFSRKRGGKRWKRHIPPSTSRPQMMKEWQEAHPKREYKIEVE